MAEVKYILSKKCSFPLFTFAVCHFTSHVCRLPFHVSDFTSHICRLPFHVSHLTSAVCLFTFHVSHLTSAVCLFTFHISRFLQQRTLSSTIQCPSFLAIVRGDGLIGSLAIVDKLIGAESVSFHKEVNNCPGSPS